MLYVRTRDTTHESSSDIPARSLWFARSFVLADLLGANRRPQPENYTRLQITPRNPHREPLNERVPWRTLWKLGASFGGGLGYQVLWGFREGRHHVLRDVGPNRRARARAVVRQTAERRLYSRSSVPSLLSPSHTTLARSHSRCLWSHLLLLRLSTPQPPGRSRTTSIARLFYFSCTTTTTISLSPISRWLCASV